MALDFAPVLKHTKALTTHCQRRPEVVVHQMSHQARLSNRLVASRLAARDELGRLASILADMVVCLHVPPHGVVIEVLHTRAAYSFRPAVDLPF
jgi:hypothetical protein